LELDSRGSELVDRGFDVVDGEVQDRVLRRLVRFLLVDEHRVPVAGLEREQAAADLDDARDAEGLGVKPVCPGQVVDGEPGVERRVLQHWYLLPTRARPGRAGGPGRGNRSRVS